MPHLHRFFVAPETDASGEVSLESREAHHALHVVRVKTGDPVILFDGRGRELVGTVSKATRRDVTVAVSEERLTPAPAKRLTLVQGWLHRERSVDDLVRRCTEVGVSKFRFFRATRSERSPKVTEKLERAAIEACKQCGRLWLPEFDTADDLENALEDAGGRILVATKGPEPQPLETAVQGDDIALVVGPEGDLTPDELETIQALGGIPISLGPTTFRSEAAATVASALILYEWGLLGG